MPGKFANNFIHLKHRSTSNLSLNRAEARKIFAVLIGEPVFDKAMQKYLPVSVLRSIQRTVDALRAQHAVRIQIDSLWPLATTQQLLPTLKCE